MRDIRAAAARCEITTPFGAPVEPDENSTNAGSWDSSRVTGGWPSDDPLSSIIWEAFKPESEPRRDKAEEEEAPKAEAKKAEHKEESGDKEFLQREGGIY